MGIDRQHAEAHLKTMWPARHWPLAVLFTAMMGMAGCSAPATHAADSNSPITVPARWELVELMGKPIEPHAGQVPWINFEPKENRLHGFSGCNRFSGSFEIGPGGSIRFSRMMTTQMACQFMSMEAEFHRVVGVADNFNVSDEDLVLNRARMAPLARFKAKGHKPN